LCLGGRNWRKLHEEELCSFHSDTIPYQYEQIKGTQMCGKCGDEATLAQMVLTVLGVRIRGLLPPLFSPVTFPVARNCSTDVFTVFLGVSLHLYWFLNRRWTVTIGFVWRNHSTIRVFCSVISGAAILNDFTAASVAKYGKKF